MLGIKFLKKDQLDVYHQFKDTTLNHQNLNYYTFKIPKFWKKILKMLITHKKSWKWKWINLLVCKLPQVIWKVNNTVMMKKYIISIKMKK